MIHGPVRTKRVPGKFPVQRRMRECGKTICHRPEMAPDLFNQLQTVWPHRTQRHPVDGGDHPGEARLSRRIIDDRAGAAVNATDDCGHLQLGISFCQMLKRGDLHLDNVVFTDHGPRILDWQKTSLGDPLDDLARLFLEATPNPFLQQLLEAAKRLPGPTPSVSEVAASSLLVWSGFITGLAGRPDLEPGSRDRRLADRLLGPEGPRRLVSEAIEAMEA